MAQIVVTEIPAEGLSLTFTEEAAALDVSLSGVRFAEPIAVEVRVVKTGQAIRATGRIAVPVAYECVRCLREFLAPLDMTVAAQFLPTPPPPAPGEYRMPKAEAEDYYYSEDIVILDDLVRQEVLLAMPFSPQCSAACRGLCAQCGQDLNVRACACAPPPDPRLAGLREYMLKKRSRM